MLVPLCNVKSIATARLPERSCLESGNCGGLHDSTTNIHGLGAAMYVKNLVFSC